MPDTAARFALGDLPGANVSASGRDVVLAYPLASMELADDDLENGAIVQAIRNGAVLQARAAMRRHLVNSRKRYQRLAAKLGSR